MPLARSIGLILLGLAAAAPADAQIVGRRSYDPVPPPSLFLPDSRLPGAPIADEVEDMRGDSRRARNAGLLPRRDARRLDREARRLAHAAARYARDGLSDGERAELRDRGQALRSVIVRP